MAEAQGRLWSSSPEEDVEMEDANNSDPLNELPEMIKNQLCVRPDDVDTDMDDLRTSSRNSPAPIHYAYEPAFSNRIVHRRSGGLPSPKPCCSCIQEQFIYEESDANITRKQTFSRVLHPSTFWDKHEHFRSWVRAAVSSLILVLAILATYSLWRDWRQGVDLMVAEESNDGFYSAQFAQRMYEQNLCDQGPPLDLIERCLELDKIRNKDYAAVPSLLGMTKMMRAMISSLLHKSDWRVFMIILIPFLLIKLLRIC